MNQKEINSHSIQELNELVELNTQFLEILLKELIVSSLNYSGKNDIPLPQNTHFLILETHRRYRDIINIKNQCLINYQEFKNFFILNLQLLEASKELTNILIAYSEKNGIALPIRFYHLIFKANDQLNHGKIIIDAEELSDEILQVDEPDEDLTEPIFTKV